MQTKSKLEILINVVISLNSIANNFYSIKSCSKTLFVFKLKTHLLIGMFLLGSRSALLDKL